MKHVKRDRTILLMTNERYHLFFINASIKQFLKLGSNENMSRILIAIKCMKTQTSHGALNTKL
jgi:hypothetical protein